MRTEYPSFFLPGLVKQIEMREIDCQECGETLELLYGEPYCPGCGEYVEFNRDGTQK